MSNMYYCCTDLKKGDPVEWCQCGAIKHAGKLHGWRDKAVDAMPHDGVLERAVRCVRTWPAHMRSAK